MKFLCVGETYEKDGESKISWKRIGEAFTSRAGKEYIKLYHMPGVLISIFEDEKKDKPSQKGASKRSPHGLSDDELKPDEDVPF